MSENWRDRLSGFWAKADEPAQPITFPAELRSCHPHVAFDATFQVWWQSSDQATFWTARQKATQLADQMSARYCVTQAGNAENENQYTHR